MPLRIVHTADVHLDTAFRGLGAEKGRLKRRAARDAFKAIINDCLAWPADILVIAGDLYESECISPDTVGFLKAEFARLDGLPVVITPGNHDPYIDTSPYAVTDWTANVHIFTSDRVEELAVPGIQIAIHGFAHTSHHLPGRLVERVERVDGKPLLVAHASREAAVHEKSEENVLPFTDDELLSAGYTYTALGHFHKPQTVEEAGVIRACYPGSPEGITFAETGRRHHLRVTLDGGVVTTEKIPVSVIDYCDVEIPCDDYVTREQFFQALERLDIKNAGKTALRVTAAGRPDPAFSLVGEPPGEITNRFFHLEIRDKTLPAYDWAEIEAEDSLRGEVARLFAVRIAEAEEERGELFERARRVAIEALDGRNVELPPEVLRVD